MEVRLGSKSYHLNQEQRSQCGYFDDIKESCVDLTVEFNRNNISVEDMDEFVRLLEKKPNMLTFEKLAFFAMYFFCKPAEDYFLQRCPQDLEWKLRYLEKNPTCEFLVPAVAQALFPAVIMGERDFTGLPLCLIRHLHSLSLKTFTQMINASSRSRQKNCILGNRQCYDETGIFSNNTSNSAFFGKA